jgi:hypothetical protein
MSGPKDAYGERPRSRRGHGRRLSQDNIAEIRYAVDIANSRARREGIKPKLSRIVLFSCACNCFSIHVD